MWQFLKYVKVLWHVIRCKVSHACLKKKKGIIMQQKKVRSYMQSYTEIKYESVYSATCVTRLFLKCHSNWIPSKFWVANWQFWSLILAVEEHRCHFSISFHNQTVILCGLHPQETGHDTQVKTLCAEYSHPHIHK